MPQLYIRKFGSDLDDHTQPVRSTEGGQITDEPYWFEVWDAETDEKLREFKGQGAEQKAKNFVSGKGE